MVWYSHLLKNFPQFVVIYTKALAVNKAKVDVFLEVSCFFHEPADVGNLISGTHSQIKRTIYVYMALRLQPKNNGKMYCTPSLSIFLLLKRVGLNPV